MPLLYIVRHAECESNTPGMIQGQIDSPLTDLGICQARAVADRLACEKLSAFYSSDLCRARDTAIAIARHHNLPVHTTPLLRECCLGVAQGLTESEFAARWPEEYRKWKEDPIANRPPGAERFEQVIGRCGIFLDQVSAAHSGGERVVVVGHVGSISGLVCAAFDLPVRVYLGIRVQNASLTILEIGDQPVLHVLNDACHLH